jgi:hypothetical protein
MYSTVPVPVPDPDLFSTLFQQQKFVHNLAFSMLEAALFPRKLTSIFLFFDFCITFYDFILDSGPNPVPLFRRFHNTVCVCVAFQLMRINENPELVFKIII